MQRHGRAAVPPFCGKDTPMAPTGSAPNDTLTSSEAGQLIGLSRKRIWHYVNSGELPATRVGPSRSVRITRADLLAFAQAKNYPVQEAK